MKTRVSATIACADDEKVVGGGGRCVGSWAFMNGSYVVGNGWYIGCDNKDAIVYDAVVYALCAK